MLKRSSAVRTARSASTSDPQERDAAQATKATLSRRDFGVLLLGLGAAQMGLLPAAAQNGPLVFAIIGDYGWDGPNELAVSELVKSWNPEFIVTNGDNNYGDKVNPDATQGSAATIDLNVGKYYHDFIYPYTGAYGPSADINRFFPILADKDFNPVTGYQAHLDFFTLPGNERYYDFVWGPVHFFMLNSDLDEPDSPRHPSIQSAWLRERLAASTAPWKLVHLHHPPYSSNTSFTRSQWPFAEWGAHVVSSGQAHVYERILRDGIVYFINGLGGRSRGDFETVIPGSAVRFGDAFGAQRVTATPDRITFEFFTTAGVLIDSFTLIKNTLAAPTNLTATATSTTQVQLAWEDISGIEDGYKVERSTDGTHFTEIASLPANTTAYQDTVVAPATQYYYQVRAFRGAVFSGYSNVAQVPNNAPEANAGSDQQLNAAGLLTTVNLSGSGTDVDGDPLSFEWIFEGKVIATGTQATVQLPFGNHTVILAARDPRGAVGMDTVQIRILLPPSTNDAKITGSGTVPAPGGTGTFSVSAQYKHGQHSGSATWSAPNGVQVVGTEIAGVIVNGNRGEIFGVGLLQDGSIIRFRADVEDLGNPGKNDQFAITLTNGYSAGGRLRGGNVKIH